MSNFSSVEERRGLVFALGAYLFWGFAPVYFKWVAEVPAHEVLAHRIVWSVPVTLLLLYILRQPQQWLAIFKDSRTLGKLMVSATLVSFNWFIFVWAIANDRILDTSLGYFINPLLTIALGVVVLKEKLNPLKFLALLCAAAGVAWQVVVIGGVPWVSLGLACSFALYGLMRKQIVVSALNGLMIETLVLSPIAAAYLLWIAMEGKGVFFTVSWSTDILLILAGLVTVVPLAMFAAGARRLTLTSMGFLQYLSPSCTFLLAIFVYHEPFTHSRLASFACIWLGLALLTWDSVKTYHAQNPHD